LFDFEKQIATRRKDKPFTLERVAKALVALGGQPQNMRFVHIAGTKGKGSVAEYLARLLQDRGLKPLGIFTSPHLIRVHERIRIGRYAIEEQDLLRLSHQVDRLNQEQFSGGLSYFEVLFLIACLYYREKEAKLVILETGIGGRLDATNVITAELSILTRIDYDHQDMLGSTLEQIAGEKAGIIKGGEVLALWQTEEVNRVFRNKAGQVNAKLHWTKTEPDQSARGENSCLALQAAQILLPQSSPWPNVADIAKIPLPARLQRFDWHGHQLLLDVAHNPVSFKELVAFLLREKLTSNCTFCFAMADSRDPAIMLEILRPVMESVTFAPLPGGRPGIPPNQLADTFAAISEKKSALLPDCNQALRQWLETPHRGIKVITGSFYLVGEALRVMGIEPLDILANQP